MSKQNMALHEKFYVTFPKRGTHGSQLEKIKASDDPSISELGRVVDELSRQIAQALVEFSRIGLTGTYEAVYRARGPASRIVRKSSFALALAQMGPEAELMYLKNLTEEAEGE